jgi:hypothetical protein
MLPIQPSHQRLDPPPQQILIHFRRLAVEMMESFPANLLSVSAPDGSQLPSEFLGGMTLGGIR